MLGPTAEALRRIKLCLLLEVSLPRCPKATVYRKLWLDDTRDFGPKCLLNIRSAPLPFLGIFSSAERYVNCYQTERSYVVQLSNCQVTTALRLPTPPNAGTLARYQLDKGNIKPRGMQ